MTLADITAATAEAVASQPAGVTWPMVGMAAVLGAIGVATFYVFYRIMRDCQ